ncbi:hypothetical protein AAHE18_15G114400 [Arachis hypogaea]|uniref:Uncharacterized protein n=1 Tax=Arachis hypogaea TaxID=3818 RepID=A0A444Z759_ARAHY|nr:hypothetical protein Ahy_B05g078448 isoform A [Arachis hypogaea]
MGVQTIINYACSRNLYQEKRAGSKLKSRIVAERSIHKWSHIIGQFGGSNCKNT